MRREQDRGLVLRERRTLRASREQVFEALTEPVLLAQWWGPAGFTLPEIELDLRPGGRYRFGMQPPGGEVFYLAGEYVEIRPPRLLVYTFRWEEPDPDDQETTVRLTLDACEGSTELSLTQGEFLTHARLALHTNGWGDSLARLSRLFGPEGPMPTWP